MAEPRRKVSESWDETGEEVRKVTEDMGTMKFGHRPPAWVLVFPVRNASGTSCASGDDRVSEETRNLIVKEVLTNASFFENRRRNAANDSRAELDKFGYRSSGGYKYFGSVTELDEFDDTVTVTDEMVKIYSKALTAQTMSQLRQCFLELILEYLEDPQCGLNARAFASQDGSELFVAISASEKCLVVAADHLNYQLQFRRDVTQGFMGDFATVNDPEQVAFESDEPYVQYDLQEDFKFRSKFASPDGKLHCSPFRLAQDDAEIIRNRSPKILESENTPCWKIKLTDEEYALKLEDQDVGSSHSIFRSSDRIRLVRALIERLVSLDALKAEGIVSEAYCCHDQIVRQSLEHDWASLRNVFSFFLPVDQIRDYCGENIAFRFAFVQFVIVTISPLAILGLTHRYIPKDIPTIPIFGFSMFLWMQLMLKFWSRRETRLKLRWGMEGLGVAEEVRAQFKGKWRTSEVNGHQQEKVEDSWQPLRFTIAFVLSTMGIGLMLLVQVLLIGWKIKTNPRSLDFSIINAIQVHVFRVIWRRMAMWLTRFENHRTQQEFSRAYSLRIFWFMFLNTMTNFSYLAYVKGFITGCDHEEVHDWFLAIEQYFHTREYGKCGSELAISLIVLFIADLMFEIRHVVPLAKSPLLLLLTVCPCARRVSRAKTDGYQPLAERTVSPSHKDRDAANDTWLYHPEFADPQPGFVEMQRHMAEFNDDEQAVTRARNLVDICLIAFFGMAVPEIVAFFALGLLLRMRLFGRRLVHVMRRTYPLASEGISYWSAIVSRIFMLAAVCNIFCLVFQYSRMPEEDDLFRHIKNFISTRDVDVPRDRDWKAMLAAVCFFENAVILPIVFGVQFYIPDEESSTSVHRKRREHIRWVYNKVLSDTKAKGETELMRRAFEPHRLFYLRLNNDGTVVWESMSRASGSSISEFAKVYRAMCEGNSTIGWCKAGESPDNRFVGVKGSEDHDRLFAVPSSSPWSLRGCCL